MERKLLPPSGLKPPQIRCAERVRFDNIPLLYTQEAPSRLGRKDPLAFVPSRLKRRSKSVTDLRSVTDVRRPPAADMPMISASSIALKKTAAGNKRPIVTTKANEGGTKAKVAKKIPPWDYKSRFNDLNEKYQSLQNTAKDQAAKIEGYDRLQAANLEMENELRQITLERNELKAETSALKLKCIAFNQLQEENSVLKSDLQTCLNEKNEILPKYEEALTNFENTWNALNASELSIANMRDLLIKYEMERRVMHNMIQDLKGNIRVFCRVRPPLCADGEKMLCTINYPDDHTLEISKVCANQTPGKDSKNEFTFDKVFPINSTQEEVFEDLSQLVQSALDGYHVCVFAYGQTGSGKTFTMQGGEGSSKGMIPRTSFLIFDSIDNLSKSGWKYSVEVSFLEVYNEIVRDLLNQHEQKKMDICFNEGKGTTVTNLTIQPVRSASELEKYILLAHNCRTTAATNFNEHSSRSHAVTKIYITGTNKEHGVEYKGSINLVDLAGSESAKHSVSEDRLQETKNINKSLSTLGDVMYALCNKNGYIPYRNSKLTYLLQSSLGGNSKTLMIVNIAPFSECFRESLQSLRFAAKVKEVKTAVKRNKSNLL